MIAAVPAAFMTAVTMTFVFNSNLYLGKIPFFPPISLYLGVGLGIALFVLYMVKAPKGAKAAK